MSAYVIVIIHKMKSEEGRNCQAWRFCGRQSFRTSHARRDGGNAKIDYLAVVPLDRGSGKLAE